MKTFGQVLVEARKATGLTQKAVAERLCRGDGRKVLPPWLNDLEHDRRYPTENAVIEQFAEIFHMVRVLSPPPVISLSDTIGPARRDIQRLQRYSDVSDIVMNGR